MLHSGERGQMYTDESGKPLWISINDQHLVPTIFTMWANPYLAKIVLTPGQVLEVLQGGADLMIPGCFPPYPDVKKGQVVAVGLLARPTVPIGVGVALEDIATLDREVKGKAVQMVHVIGDTLCTKFKNELKPPMEFDLSLPYKTEEDDGKIAETTNDVENLSIKETAKESEETVSDQSAEKEANTNSSSAELDEFTTEEVDSAFRVALLQTLKKAVDTPIELPISSSLFLGSYILENLPFDSPNLTLKKSTWKKASKFLKAMEKENLLKVKDRGDDVVIQSIVGAGDERVRSFQIFKTKTKKKSSAGNVKPKVVKMTAIELWKPHFGAANFLKEADPNSARTTFYDNKMLRTVLVDYINKHKLAEKKNILADDLLANGLNLPKEGALNPKLRIVPREKLLSLFQASCTAYHIIYDPTVSDETAALLKTFKPVKGSVPTILIETERRGGNKVVTKISSLDKFRIDPHVFAEELRKTCAGSTTVGEKMEVIVQGPQIKAAQDALVQRGISLNWIEVKEKGTKNGKKIR